MAKADNGVSSASTPIESPAYEIIRPKLSRTAEDERPIIVMTCGMAGSGKSTLAKTILARLPNFERLSGDKYIHDKYGLYGIDYSRDKYDAYQDEAQAYIQSRLVTLIKEGANGGILDLSFYDKEYRDEYKAIIEKAGGRWVLVYLDAKKDLLWSRIQNRRAARDVLPLDSSARNGDSAYDIEPETFEMYWNGFEAPSGEGEIAVPIV